MATRAALAVKRAQALDRLTAAALALSVEFGIDPPDFTTPYPIRDTEGKFAHHISVMAGWLETLSSSKTEPDEGDQELDNTQEAEEPEEANPYIKDNSKATEARIEAENQIVTVAQLTERYASLPRRNLNKEAVRWGIAVHQDMLREEIIELIAQAMNEDK